jgi:hypothetical protein
MVPLEFTNVLYVPSLFSNLLSVLYLTIHYSFTVSIVRDTLDFIRDGHTVIQAKVVNLRHSLPSNSSELRQSTS